MQRSRKNAPALRASSPARGRSVLLALVLSLAATLPAAAQTITFAKHDAVVWSQEQTITGSSSVTSGVLRVGGNTIPFEAPTGTFAEAVWIGEGTTTVLACTADLTSCPDTLRLTLGYEPRPEAELRAAVSGRAVTLTGRILANPDSAALTFAWRPDPGNPAAVSLTPTTDSTATATLPSESGEYYFDWLVFSADDTVRARTFVTAYPDSVVPFTMETDHAAWVDSAVIYGVTPYNYRHPGILDHVTTDLSRIAALGVDAIWVLPVFSTSDQRGPGYWVTDHFRVRTDYGTEEDLHELVEAAHALGMKVMLDFVPHAHLDHAYAQEVIAHGDSSHYFDFFQRERGTDRYSSQARPRTVGEMTFYYYFDWGQLVNLNYDSPEVQSYITEAARYWIEEFDVDGYRIDAIWGPRARNPEYFKEWRNALKRVKPEVLLLGEDKATDASAFPTWDAAYDWYNGNAWISEWGWQPGGHTSPTIFQATESRRSELLRGAMTNKGQGWHPDALVLRFMENNDTERFIAGHGPQRTKMAAALLFSLPGIPLLFNGQEYGERAQPYEDASYNLFPLEDEHVLELYPYYRHLVSLRHAFPALTADTYAEVAVTPDTIAGRTFAFRRWTDDEHVLTAINMGASAVNATLRLSAADMQAEPGVTYFLTDLVTGEAAASFGGDVDSIAIEIPVPAYTTRIFGMADHILAIPTAADPSDGEGATSRLALEQNHPNPFRAATRISFELPAPGHVRLTVYDVLGRAVATLADQNYPAGSHTVTFNAAALPSGLYLYRLEHPSGPAVRSMLLVR